MERSKEEFLRRFGEDYGYPNAPKNIDEIRASEFKRLQGLVYLDHAGAALYSEAQMEAVVKDLTSNVYGNPHSLNDSSMATSDIISAARQQVLNYFNASPKNYVCIFTSGATAALKLVGEGFPWSRESWYMYTMENHNSVLGIREGATALAVDIEDVKLHGRQEGTNESSVRILKHSVQRRAEAKFPQDGMIGKLSDNAYNLFAFPSECNFSGQKFCLDLVKVIKDDAQKIFEGSQGGQWMVLVDAAKGSATDPPDLARYPADFVVFSFYKIFGYPTGLGALVVRTEAARILTKTYFSGGTVSASIADIDFIKRREHIEQVLEDGTLSFLAIASIRHGFNVIDALTTSAISRHTTSLAAYVRNMMMDLKHENGVNVCTIYGRDIAKVLSLDLGATITFNLRRADGSWYGYHEVEKLACLSGIQLRTGCFCNPGACAKYLGLSHSDLLSNYEAGHVCWDDKDVLHGKPTGAVRISFGYMSTFEDAEKFLSFLEISFVAKHKSSNGKCQLSTEAVPLSGIGWQQLAGNVQLKSIMVYPVKSCAGFSMYSWPLSNMGLKYDREWLLKGPSDEILTQKKVPEMCNIRTFVDLEQGKLFLESPRCKEKLQVSLAKNSFWEMEEMNAYGQRYEVMTYDDEVNMWFTEAIARPCTFVRCSSSKKRSCMNKVGREGQCRDSESKLTFVNEAQILLISEDSVHDLNSRLNSTDMQKDYSGSGQPVLVDAMRFRPNLIISGAKPYVEDSWRSLQIGEAHFTSLGGCNRCQMINLDQQSGQVRKLKEPLATLASYRRVQGKILFGVLLRYEDCIMEDGEEKNGKERWLQVGQEVYPSID
ncbi:molybdenum cofactor sulfurase isoform X3 [Phoenix dactylifera]|uniref:Molybdenum cofactor sulfurase n=1 Tax=Phoenix dactylifera TaxID=42345 RepID=A0A8B8JDF4_PHODC|nr:molybdenum cofactor sulfurase isoform X3 [Phoenix dactylifera]